MVNTKPTLKINFSDFWAGFDFKNNYFYNILSDRYNIELSESPDLLIYSLYGNNYLNYNCYRICYTAENERIDFTGCDFGIGFDYLEHEDYLRLPLYVAYLDGDFDRISKKGLDLNVEYNRKTRFCNMIVSNPHSSKRIDFFKKLSAYKTVDSGGKYMNNIGGPVQDKEQFISQYKFTFAFENSSYPGYTTEKLVQPMKVHSMPIYWGNPFVNKEFNTNSFINWHDYNDDELLIERIIEIDSKRDLYMHCLEQEYITNQQILETFSRERMATVFDGIVYKAKHTKPKALTYYKWAHSLNNKKKVFIFLMKKVVGIKNFR
jgi:hypothetical protein